MRRLTISAFSAAALFALLEVSAACSQAAPSAASSPGAAGASQSPRHAPNNGVLKAMRADPSAAVVRDGFGQAGDGPPVVYVGVARACEANSGAGDGGAEIAAAGGGCWQAQFGPSADVRSWGASCSAGADSTAALQQALNWLPRGGRTLRLPCMVGVSQGVALGNHAGALEPDAGVQNFALIGAASGGQFNQFGSAVNAGGIRYIGSSPLRGAVLTIDGPISGRLRDLQIDCGDYRADTGLLVHHLLNSDNQNITIANCNQTGLRLDAFPNARIYDGGNDVDWRNLSISMQKASAPAAAGLDIGFASMNPGDVGLDVARNHFHTGSILMPPREDACAITLRGADLDTFDGLFTYSTGKATGAYGVCVKPPRNASFLPNSITFINSPLVGGVRIEPGWTCATGGAGEGLAFFGLPTGDMTAQGRPIPSGGCIHGFTNNGVMLDQYQPLSRRGPGVFSSPTTLFRDDLSRVVENTNRLTELDSYDLPGGALSYAEPDRGGVRWDRSLLVDCTGAVRNDTGANQTFRVLVTYGAQAVSDTQSVTVPSGGYRSWRMEVLLFAAGAANAQRGYGVFRLGGRGSATAMMQPDTSYSNEVSGLALDAGMTRPLTVSAELGAAAAGLRVVKDQCSIVMQ